MATPARPLVSLGLALLVALVAVGASGFTDEVENYKRLEAMPRERRADLAENLGRFDRLDPKEQAALRKLDVAISRKDPVDQARYRAILRRYHLWVSGLTDDQKKKLEAATDPDERFNLARKYRLSEADDRSRKKSLISGIRTGHFGISGPIEAGFLLKIWRKLPESKKAEIARRDGNRLRAELRSQANAAGVKWEPFAKADDDTYIGRLEADPEFKSLLGPLAKRAEAAQRKFDHPFAEFLYFEEHPPRPVDPRNLDRFVASCPAWLLGMLDPLSPGDARSYLTILYRQLHPHPNEMPEPGKEKPKVEPSSKPAPQKGQASPPPS